VLLAQHPVDLLALVVLLTREVSSLRSAMARQALTCCAELPEAWRAGLPAPACTALVTALVTRASNSADKKFIRDLALLALTRCALAQPSSDMLLHVLTLDTIARNKAAALVAATTADSLSALRCPQQH
jgi:hypothetical protein